MMSPASGIGYRIPAKIFRRLFLNICSYINSDQVLVKEEKRAVGSFWMMVFYLPLGLYLAFYVIPREEAYMYRRCGDAYRTYSRQVRRWLQP